MILLGLLFNDRGTSYMWKSVGLQLVYSLMIEAHPICGNLDLLTIKLLVVVWMLIYQKEKKNISV